MLIPMCQRKLRMGGILRDIPYLVRAKPVDSKRHLINRHDRHKWQENGKPLKLFLNFFVLDISKVQRLMQ